MPPEPPAAEPALQPGAPAPVDWRRNLAALWLAEFTAILGFAFAFPFLPLFLHRELHIPSGPELSFWTGVSAASTGFALALTSPIWGRLADRYGRKPMLVRAMFGGGISVGLMGLAQSALQLTVLRGIQGASSGTVAAATALVATETPPAHLAWALGILNSAISLGSAAGPATGGLAANLFGLRAIFIGGGLLLLLAAVPVLIVVRESPRRPRAVTPPTLEALRAAGTGTIKALTVLMIAEALQQTSYGAAQPLIALRLLQLIPDAAQAQSITGITFAAAGIVTALAAVIYSRLLRRSSYRVITATAALLTGLTLMGSALSTAPPLLILTFVAASFLSGALIPAFGTMIGLESPALIQATIFGISSSFVSVGFGFGPLIGGFTASAFSVQAGLAAAGIIALVLAALIALAAREPPALHRGAI